MNKYNPILKQFLVLISRSDFEKLVNETDAEKGAKGFTSWNHLLSMVVAQISGQTSLRSIEATMASVSNCFYHMGIKDGAKRSTLSYANNNRPYQLFEMLFYFLVDKLQNMKIDNRKFKFKNPLYSLDATFLYLQVDQFPWAHYQHNKGGIKLTVKLDNKANIPCHFIVTDGKDHDIIGGRKVPAKKGEILVFDRGYFDILFLSKLNNAGVFFVTRLKKGVNYREDGNFKEIKNKNILCDEVIWIKNTRKKVEEFRLRKIISYDESTKKTITIITNNFELAASTIAKIYKARWDIELFFKAIKQNLKIKKFYGRSKNAVLTQIFICMIVYLLFAYLQFKTRVTKSFTEFMSVIPTMLFKRISLEDWFTGKPPDRPPPKISEFQLELPM